MQIIKRDGRYDTFDVSKVHKQTEPACIRNGLSASDLELRASKQFQEGMTSSEIQQVLVSTASDMIDIDAPKWTFVAAELFLNNLYHSVGQMYGATKGASYSHTLQEYLDLGENLGRIMPGMQDKYDLNDLDAYIKPERDLQFNYLGIKTLYDRYLVKDKREVPIELPQHMFMGISMFLAQKEEDAQGWAKKFYDMISKFEVMLATPTLSNARTPRHQLSSCYIGSTPDSIEGIFDAYEEMALLSKFGGGIGWDWSLVRSMASAIDGHSGAAGGTVPFLKITNDIAVAVDQLGTRKGAISVYMEPWHMDMKLFLDLKKNSGEERMRAHDLFPAVWVNDLFMERMNEDADWTLFDPYEVDGLQALSGKEFKEAYTAYERDSSIKRETISAKELWKTILTSYFETGMPFLGFKDEANRRNQNSHSGVIRSSNLCTEIFQNTEPDTYKTRIRFKDGSQSIYEEDDIITVDGDINKKSSKVTTIDTIDGKEIYFADKERVLGRTAVCNLASINLSKIHTQEDIDRIVPTAVRCLDNVIDLNFYPTEKVMLANQETRSIGLGVMGEAQMLAEKGIHFGSNAHYLLIDEVMENVSYATINASADLSTEKGQYPMFEGSGWSKGIMTIDSANEDAKSIISREHHRDWDRLRDKVKSEGMRNGYLMAIAPTSSISILVGTTQAIEPVFKRKWFEENLSGLIPVVAPNLNADTWAFYEPAYDISQNKLVYAAGIRQKWIDQGQSTNIFIKSDKASAKYLNEIYVLAWKLGLKSTYYLRSQSPEVETEVADRSIECVGCQ